MSSCLYQLGFEATDTRLVLCFYIRVTFVPFQRLTNASHSIEILRVLSGLILGGVIFISGAVGMELVNAGNRSTSQQQAASELAELAKHSPEPPIASEHNIDLRGQTNFPYVIGTAFEEIFEMLGVVFWLGVILNIGMNGVERQAEGMPSTGGRTGDSSEIGGVES